MKRRIVSVLLSACICAALCGCASKEIVQPEQPAGSTAAAPRQDEPDETAAPIPTATSKELNLYAFSLSNGIRYVVNDQGEYEKEFSLDPEGNLVDSEGKILITAENVSSYQPLRTMYFSQSRYAISDEKKDLNPAEEANSEKPYRDCLLELYSAPASATNRVISVKSSSNEVVEIRPESNAQLIEPVGRRLEAGEILIKVADLSQPVRISVRVLKSMSGDAAVIARSMDDTAKAECVVSTLSQQPQTIASQGGRAAETPAPSPTPAIAPIQNVTEFVNASGNPANHVHTYVKSITEPTADSIGYTTYTCTGCGYSYQEDFTSKLTPEEPVRPDHIHNYASITIAPTATEPGYTLYVCDICGDSFRANYTQASEN